MRCADPSVSSSSAAAAAVATDSASGPSSSFASRIPVQQQQPLSPCNHHKNHERHPPSSSIPHCKSNYNKYKDPPNDHDDDYNYNPHRLIIFDWDDTLCPSSYLDRVSSSSTTFSSSTPPVSPLEKDQNNSNPAHAKNSHTTTHHENNDDLIHQHHHTQMMMMMMSMAIAQAARTCLMEACKHGTVVIITNSDEGWVQYSCEQYLPHLLPFLFGNNRNDHEQKNDHTRLDDEGDDHEHGLYYNNCASHGTTMNIRIVSARTRYEHCYPHQPVCWKAAAFAHEFNDFFQSHLQLVQLQQHQRKTGYPAVFAEETTFEHDGDDCDYCDDTRTIVTTTTATTTDTSFSSSTNTSSSHHSTTDDNHDLEDVVEKKEDDAYHTHLSERRSRNRDCHRRQSRSRSNQNDDHNHMHYEIISIGDSNEERTAAAIVAQQQHASAKSVAFLSGPTPLQIVGQLVWLTQHMTGVCNHHCDHTADDAAMYTDPLQRLLLDLQISPEQAERSAAAFFQTPLVPPAAAPIHHNHHDDHQPHTLYPDPSASSQQSLESQHYHDHKEEDSPPPMPSRQPPSSSSSNPSSLKNRRRKQSRNRNSSSHHHNHHYRNHQRTNDDDNMDMNDEKKKNSENDKVEAAVVSVTAVWEGCGCWGGIPPDE